MARLLDRIGPFVAVPKSLVDGCASLSHSAFRVFVTLRYFTSNDTDTVFPSYKRLREMTGMQFKTIAQAIRDLEKAGWLSRKKRYGKSVIYELHSPMQTHSDSPMQRDPISPIGDAKTNETYSNETQNIKIGADAPRATKTQPEVNDVKEVTMTTPEGIAKADTVFLAFASKDHSEKAILRQHASDNAKALMSAFHQTTGLPWMKSWNSAANDMDGVGVTADDVRESCRRLKQQRMSVCDLYSAKKTAILVATERKAKSNGHAPGGQWVEENGVMVLYER